MKTYMIVLAVLAAPIAVTASAENADILDGGKWRQIETRTVDELEGFTAPDGIEFSRYGGLIGEKVDATGFFRTEKIDGRWWLVDPQGHRFVSVGLCSVNRSGVDADLLAARFGNQQTWAIRTGEMLKKYGFNTLGCWSDWRVFRPTEQRMPYTPRWNFMAVYKSRRDRRNGERGFPNQCMPVFDEEFELFCDEHARQLSPGRDDPWLLGHFSDNELPFRPNALTNYLALPESDTGHKAARQWWEARRQKLGSREISEADQEAFMEYLARRYYTIVSRAIKKYDSNHLYLGSRIHGRTIRPPVFRGAGGLVDVMSVNYYHRWSAEQERLSQWVRCVDAPFIVSEWYAQSLDRPDADASGAGFRVRTDRDRGLFYQNLTLGLLENGGCVGWHWFKYGGDGTQFHKGLVSRQYEPHTDTLELMARLNRHVYAIIEYFDTREDPPSP